MLEKNKEGAKPFCKCIKQILRRKWLCQIPGDLLPDRIMFAVVTSDTCNVMDGLVITLLAKQPNEMLPADLVNRAYRT